MKRIFTLFITFFLVSSLAISGSALGPSAPVWSRYGKSDNVYSQVSTEEKAVALTFDDGPHPTYTAEILDILREYGIKATFFVIGENVERSKEVLKRCADEGHEIGNHTYSHASANNCTTRTLKEEIEKTDRFAITNHIAKAGGKRRLLFVVCSNRKIFCGFRLHFPRNCAIL